MKSLLQVASASASVRFEGNADDLLGAHERLRELVMGTAEGDIMLGRLLAQGLRRFPPQQAAARRAEAAVAGVEGRSSLRCVRPVRSPTQNPRISFLRCQIATKITKEQTKK